MNTKKILLLTWRDLKHPGAGGVDIRYYELCKRLVRQGHDVTFLSSKFRNAKKQDKLGGIKIIRTGGKYTLSLAAAYHYLSKLKKNKYDIVIEELNKVPFFTPLYVRRPKLACYSQLNDGIFFKELFFPFALVAYFMEQALMPLIYMKTFFAVDSRSTRDELVEVGINKKRILMVYNGLNHTDYKPIPFSKKKASQLVVLSRLKRYKGIQYAIRAMSLILKELPDTRLYIVGKGNYEKTLKRLVKKLNLGQSIVFLDYAPEKKKLKLLQESALLLNPSFKEGWGINVIEANACGTPVVASRVYGLKESVIDEKTGILVPYGDDEAIAKTVVSLLKNKRLRKEMGENALKHAKKFSWEKSCASFLNAIKKVINHEG